MQKQKIKCSLNGLIEFDDLKRNPFCGIQIPKKLIPRAYIKKYGIDNLWKHDLPKDLDIEILTSVDILGAYSMRVNEFI